VHNLSFLMQAAVYCKDLQTFHSFDEISKWLEAGLKRQRQEAGGRSAGERKSGWLQIALPLVCLVQNNSIQKPTSQTSRAHPTRSTTPSPFQFQSNNLQADHQGPAGCLF